MRIAFLTYSMTGGGAERVIAETANYFSRVYKDEVWILELSDTDSAYPLNPEIHLVRMKIARESRNVLDSVGNFLSYQKTIRRFVREQQIEVLISSSVKHGVTVKLGMPWLKVIGSEHSNPYMAARGRGERVTRFLSPVMDGCIFLTQGAKQYYPAALGKKSRVIHNAVYLDSHALKPLTYEKREKNVISTGNLRALKRHDLIIEAFDRFHQEHRDYELYIYGSGDLESRIRKDIESRNLNDCVHMMGFSLGLAEILCKSRLFLLASDYEGMPTGLLEALGCGCACISTDCNELISNNENGLLINVGDGDALYQAMCRIAEDDALGTRLSENAQKIMETHSMDSIAERYHNYISAVVKGDKNVHCEGLV